MGEAARKRATYDDLFSLPAHQVGEIIGGVLHAQPRPSLRHALVSSVLGGELEPAFGRGRGGPGGWVILDEPELHLGSEPDIVVPDLAGWRRQRMPEIPDAAFVTLPPDWVCEVLSPATQRLDRGKKLPLYQRERVGHVWMVDPGGRTLEVFRLDGDSYRFIATHSDEDRCRVEPFDAIELDLQALWRA